MLTAAQITTARLTLEEGKRRRLYNDATSQTVSCRPAGNISGGLGHNFEIPMSDKLIGAILACDLEEIEPQLLATYWYPTLDVIRQSVFLDVAFNCGLHGLLNFPKCIAAAHVGNWAEAEAQLLDSDAARKLPDRYGRLGKILLKGEL